MKKNKKTYLSAVLRNLPSVAISDLSEAEILILLKNARWGNSHCFILFNVLVARLSIKPILFLLVNNGSASIANIVFL